MPTGRLIEKIKLAPVVWGRCYSVVIADFEYASDALGEISPELDASLLREIEAMHSERTRERNSLLAGSSRDRPVGPYSSVLLEALSIRGSRDGLSGEQLGGWRCHLHEEDAIAEAQRRFAAFCFATSAGRLSRRLQVYSARVAGNFANVSDVLRLLVGSRAANDSQSIVEVMDELRAFGVDGIVFDGSGNPVSALVLRGCAVSQLRQVRRIELRQDDNRRIVSDDESNDIDFDCLPQPANRGLWS
ncbi:MAG: hypothetical protein IPL03_03305 [Sterolibacteriaceae bacterium]|nr:hypothetical protein [Candidatus Methylophosphatis haderslevensis]